MDQNEHTCNIYVQCDLKKYERNIFRNMWRKVTRNVSKIYQDVQLQKHASHMDVSAQEQAAVDQRNTFYSELIWKKIVIKANLFKPREWVLQQTCQEMVWTIYTYILLCVLTYIHVLYAFGWNTSSSSDGGYIQTADTTGSMSIFVQKVTYSCFVTVPLR